MHDDMMSVGVRFYHNKRLILTLYWCQTFGIWKKLILIPHVIIMHKPSWYAGRILINFILIALVGYLLLKISLI